MVAQSVTVERVALGERSYDVCLASGLSGLGERLSGRARVLVVTDSNVGPLWLDPLLEELDRPATVVTLPAGEENKNAATWLACLDEVLRARPDRRVPVVALGGGVVGDMAGFTAATALRGLPFVQVPTTLLAMVDSSVGGKTGINHATGKNRIGAFHQPVLVWAALATLSTLDERERRAGLGEVLKTALIAGGELWTLVVDQAEALRDADPVVTTRAVRLCVRAKAGIVAQDEREGGVRAVLNAGHTVGHALERALGYGVVRHGEAVAMGLVAETRYAETVGVCEEPGLARTLTGLAERLGLAVRPPATSLDDRVHAAAMDKKAVGDMVRVPLPVRPGRFVFRDLDPGALTRLVGDAE